MAITIYFKALAEVDSGAAIRKSRRRPSFWSEPDGFPRWVTAGRKNDYRQAFGCDDAQPLIELGHR